MSVILGPSSSNILQYSNIHTQNYTASYFVANISTSTYDNNSGTGPTYHYATQDIGTYAFLKNLSSTILQPGSTIAGSSLAYATSYGIYWEAYGSGKTIASYWRYATGTWRCMGYARNSGNPDTVSLFLRIS